MFLYRQDAGDGDVSWTPTIATSYTTASNITGNSGANSSSKIIYVGSASSVTDTTSLVDYQTYVYKIFAVSSSNIYNTSGLQRISILIQINFWQSETMVVVPLKTEL